MPLQRISTCHAMETPVSGSFFRVEEGQNVNAMERLSSLAIHLASILKKNNRNASSVFITFLAFLPSMFAYMLCTVARRFTVGLVNNASTILQHSDQPRYLIQSPSLCDNQFVLALFCIEPGCLFEAATIIIEIHIFRVLQNRLSRASAVTEIWDLAARRIQCARANLTH